MPENAGKEEKTREGGKDRNKCEEELRGKWED
jgi:hypothetical protein